MNLGFESSSTRLLDELPLGVIVWQLEDPGVDGSLRLVYANPAASKMTERDLDSFLGRPVYEVFPSAPPERIQAYAEVCRRRAGRDFGEVVYSNSGVGPITFSVRAVPVLDRAVALLLENLSQTGNHQMAVNFREVRREIDLGTALDCRPRHGGLADVRHDMRRSVDQQQARMFTQKQVIQLGMVHRRRIHFSVFGTVCAVLKQNFGHYE